MLIHAIICLAGAYVCSIIIELLSDHPRLLANIMTVGGVVGLEACYRAAAAKDECSVLASGPLT